MRRLKRHGQAQIVQVEPPSIVMADILEQNRDLSSHWLVGSAVRIVGLVSSPQLNGREGHVSAFEPATQRLQVHLVETADYEAKWIRVRDFNVEQTASSWRERNQST